MRTSPLKSIWIIVFLWLLDLSTASNPYCPICGPGMMVTDPDGEVFIPTYGTHTCEKLEIRSHEGYIPAENCFALQMFARNDCGCESIPPTDPPTASPTKAPTAAPSEAPTKAPLTDSASGLKLTLYGISSLPGRSIHAFINEAVAHVEGYYAESENGVEISDLTTAISVTGFQGVTGRRRNLRGSEEERDLQTQTPPYITITFTQSFGWKQSSNNLNINAEYLAERPLGSVEERENFMQALNSADPDKFGDVTGVSEVSFPIVS